MRDRLHGIDATKFFAHRVRSYKAYPGTSSTSPRHPRRHTPSLSFPAKPMSHGAKQPHVVILGGGFGGLSAARRLHKAPVRITLIDRANHHLFQPLLYQVATASLAAPSIAAPLRQILERQNDVTVLMDKVSAIDVARRAVRCADRTLDYDFLIVATGAVPGYYGHDEWRRFAPALKTMDDALLIRRRVLRAFENAERESDPARRQAWLSFVVVGGGPTGVELAGTLIELARHTLAGEFRRCDPANVSVYLVEAGARLLPDMAESMSRKAREQLQSRGVQVLLGESITGIDAGGTTAGSTRLEARTVLWAAGVAASSIGELLDAPLDKSGRVCVQPDLTLPDHPEVFVIGDLAHVVQAHGKSVPGVAPAAKQMGKYVADAINARLRNENRTPAFVYNDQGTLTTIGRAAAVAQFGKLKLSGLIAWVLWLVAHIYFLIGFRNRLMVMLDWSSAYITRQRGARLITGCRRGPDDSPEDD